MRVFPAGRMCSLRGVLMMWLLPVFLVVGAVAAFVSYLSYTHTVATFMDDQMSLLAQSVAAQSGPPSLPPVGPDQVKNWGAYVVQVFGAQGTLQSTSLPESGVAFIKEAGFHDVHGTAGDWRVYVAEGGSAHVQVAQSGTFRTKLAAGRALGVIAPVLVLLLLSGAILWIVVEMISRAVGDIARQTSGQDEHSIAELPLTHVPREIVPLVASFNSLLGRLRDAFTTQRRFVQDAAHELRTPITAIGLQLETLRSDVCCGDTRDRFTQLELGIQRAQRLVDQLLRLSRQQEAPASDPSPAEVDVPSVLRESINGLIALAEQRRIDLGLLPGPTGPVTLRGSPADLRSVLDNLIENALHHCPEGGVVDVRLTRDDQRLAVEVIDSGPGIPPELTERVFDRFFRVPGNGTRGSGLGLAIARSAASRCGLRITLRNRTDASGLIARVEQG